MADLDTSVLFAGTARRQGFTQTATDIIKLKQRGTALTLEQARQDTQKEQFKINKAEGDQDQLFRQKALTERSRQFNEAQSADQRDFQALEAHRAQQAQSKAIDQASQQKGLQLRQALAVFEAAPDTPAGRQAVRDLITGMGGNPDLIPESVTDADVNKAITNAAKVFKECEQTRNRSIGAAQKQACVTKAHTAAMAAIDAIGAMPDTPGSQQKRDFLNDQIRTSALGDRAETRRDTAIERDEASQAAQTAGSIERGDATAARTAVRDERQFKRSLARIIQSASSNAKIGGKKRMKTALTNMGNFLDQMDKTFEARKKEADEVTGGDPQASSLLNQMAADVQALVPEIRRRDARLTESGAQFSALVQDHPEAAFSLPPPTDVNFPEALSNMAGNFGEWVRANTANTERILELRAMLFEGLKEAGVEIGTRTDGQPFIVDQILNQQVNQAVRAGQARYKTPEERASAKKARRE